MRAAKVCPEPGPTLISELDHRQGRDALGLFKVERYADFVRAVDTGADIVGLVVCERLLSSPLCQMLVRRARQAGVPTTRVGPERFRGLQRATRASGIVAVVRQRWTPLAEASRGVWVAVDRLRSPGNLGTILRTCDAAGVRGVLFAGDAIDPYDPSVVGASLGGLFGLDLVRTTWPALRAWASSRGMPLAAASPGGSVDWDAWDWPDALVLALGDERDGLPPEVMASCDATVRIPLTGRGDSINVATAAGVLLFEALRRRRGRHGNA